MKNFLIVTPQFAVSGESYSFPIGIAYISSYLKKGGFNVYCLNLCHFEKNIALIDILRESIEKYKIDVFCTGAMSIYWGKVEQILQLSKKIKPDIINIVGGAILTSDPELAMENLKADIGILGEGEHTMAELAEILCNNSDIKDVRGICYMQDEKLIITPSRPNIDNLDSLPFPDYEGFEFDKYLSAAENDGKRSAEIIGSRSCPFSCTFCYHHLGQKYRQRSLENIFSEINYLREKFQVNNIIFNDELFSSDHERMKKFAAMMKNFGVIDWTGSFRVNNVKAEILKILKDGGLKKIHYGLENINDEILASMNKKTTRAEIENALKLTREAGIKFGGVLIFGDPAETEETIKNTLKWVYDNPQFGGVSLFPLITIPNSPIFQYAIKNKLITDKLKHIKEEFPTINLTKMNDYKFYSWLRKIGWLNFTQKHLLLGEVMETKKMIGHNNHIIKYSVKIKCPFCNHVTSYTKNAANVKFTTFVCEHCTSINKVFCKKLFFDDYNDWEANKGYFKAYLFLYILPKLSYFRKNKKTILLFLSETKKLFNNLFIKNNLFKPNAKN